MPSMHALFVYFLWLCGVVTAVVSAVKCVEWAWPRFLAFLRAILTSDQLVRAAPGLLELSRIAPQLEVMTRKMNGGNGWIDQVNQLQSALSTFRTEQTEHNCLMERVNNAQCRAQAETRKDLAELSGSISKVLATYVPRDEHEKRWSADDARLKAIEDRLGV